jgi:hypothetical protein
MKALVIAASAAVSATPAFAAESPTTLQVVTGRGIVMRTAFGLEISAAYTPDGKFTAQTAGGQAAGTWRIEGDRALCTRLDGPDPTETCVLYPDGKKAGDAFELDGAMGPTMGKVTVTIR